MSSRQGVWGFTYVKDVSRWIVLHTIALKLTRQVSLSNSERDVDRAQKSDGEGGHVTRFGAGSAFQVATWYKLHSTQVSVDGYASSSVGTLLECEGFL